MNGPSERTRVVHKNNRPCLVKRLWMYSPNKTNLNKSNVVVRLVTFVEDLVVKFLFFLSLML